MFEPLPLGQAISEGVALLVVVAAVAEEEEVPVVVDVALVRHHCPRHQKS